jgi:excisionase family DNA binding protein
MPENWIQSPVPTSSPAPTEECQTMTVTQFAALLGVSRQHAYRLTQQGELPVQAIRLGRRLVFSRAAVMKWLAGEAEEGQ